MSTASSSIRHLSSSSYRGLQDAVGRFVARYVRLPDDARDIVQDTWLAAMNYRGESSRKTYLIGIARRKVAEYFRGQYRRRVFVDVANSDFEGTTAASDSLVDLLSDRQAKRELLAAVAKLPPEFKSVVDLYLRGKDSLEISALLGVNYNTVRSRLSRSRTILRRQLNTEVIMQPGRTDDVDA